MTIFAKSAFKHGVTAEQMDDVLRSEYSEIFDEGFDRTGHYSAIYVGFDSQGNLLEVKAKFISLTTSDDDNTHVFHADKATTKYRRLFNQKKGK
jgi:hypothetical protein